MTDWRRNTEIRQYQIRVTELAEEDIENAGDYIADIESDMGAEQRARATYEHLMDLTDDPDILAPLAFLRQREIIHYQRFKELRDYYLEKYKNHNHA